MLPRHSVRVLQFIAAALGPAVVAALAVALEPWMTVWAKERQAMLPLVLFLLLSSLMHPRLRQLLGVTLCYGVAFLALRDIFRTRQLPMPSDWDYDFLDQARPVGLFVVAALSVLAAIAETKRPGTVWARRCYFGAAALYFTGLGVINYAWHPSWQAALLCATGVIAGAGCVYAPRIIESEAFDLEAAESDDLADQQAREADHQRTLRAKEWHETATAPETDARCNPVGSSVVAPPASP